MIDRIRKHPISGFIAGRLSARRAGPLQVRRRGWQLAAAAIALVVLYWGLIASDRYVSEARVVVDRTDLASGSTMDFASIFTGRSNARDELRMRDYLLSVDMLNKLDAELQLRAHYSDHNYDMVSRMWSAKAPQEWFHKYYLSRTAVEFDESSGTLVIKAQAYTPQQAQRIAATLVKQGEQYMNQMAHGLALEQVEFLEKQLVPMAQRVQSTRQAMLAYQNEHGLVSPQGAVETLSGIVARLEEKLAESKAKRQSMLGYLSADAPDIAQINLQIGAMEQQMAQERARLTAPTGNTLNKTAERYQRLHMEADFALDVYRTALVALEKGRVEATRKLKKVSVLQSPTLPQHALMPYRIYNIVTFILVVLLLAGILHLLVAIIRDHKD